jgi:DNA-binding LytR/AlgR family response regulator
VSTALIADDEPLPRAALKAKLARLWPELRVVGEAINGEAALQLAAEHQPDIVFLDIRMPRMSGLQAARELACATHVVFVTAYDQHAIDAFEAGAVDYLLKPVEDERLAATIDRLKQRAGRSAPPDLCELIDALTRQLALQGERYLTWIKASAGSTVRLVPVDEVIYFCSDEKYTRVVTRAGEHFIKRPIRELLTELDPRHFWQIHRSTIVNAREVAGIRRIGKDNAELVLKGRSEVLIVSRAYTHLFRQM